MDTGDLERRSDSQVIEIAPRRARATTDELGDADLRARLASDATAQVDLDLAPLVARTAERVQDTKHWNSLIAAEEIAADVVGNAWLDQRLADVFSRALAAVHDQYLRQAATVTGVLHALEREARDSWAARAISHQLAEEVAWQALDSLDLLTEFPADALCAGCGATLDRPVDGA